MRGHGAKWEGAPRKGTVLKGPKMPELGFWPSVLGSVSSVLDLAQASMCVCVSPPELDKHREWSPSQLL